MAVLNFAAHIIEYESNPNGSNAGGHYNEDGDLVDGSASEWKRLCKCDIVPGGKAATITLPDGTSSNYSYTISNLPKDCKEFNYGDNVRILFYGKEENARKFKVLGFHRYQHQCKIWV